MSNVSNLMKHALAALAAMFITGTLIGFGSFLVIYLAIALLAD